MTSERLQISAGELAPPDAERVARALAGGGLVAFPTESFYGLAASPWSAAGVERLLALKRERGDKPLPLVLASAGAVLRVASRLPPDLDRLGRRFWPGPLSLVVPAHSELVPGVTAGSGTVAVRVPGNELARTVARLAGGAATATSANPSGAQPPRSAEEVLGHFDGRLEFVLDAGLSPGGRPSTILDLTVSPARILREGPIGRSELSSLLELG